MMNQDKVFTTLKPTREYKTFQFDDINRDVIPSLVDRLEEGVIDLNLLDLYPIVTTTERVIVDGQNRFTMAKGLGLPFYYTPGERVSISDVAESNELTLSCTENDALSIFNSMSIEPYTLLSRFIEDFPGACGNTCSRPARWMSSSKVKSSFLNGGFTVDRMGWARAFAKNVTDLMEYSPIVATEPYLNALGRIMLTGCYDHGRMLDKVRAAPASIVRCGRSDHAVIVFQGVYNYKMRSANRVDFERMIVKGRIQPRDEAVVANSHQWPSRQIESSRTVLIHESRDYGAFTLHPSARPIRKVDRLAEFMKRKNLLQHYPIIINRERQILDGQRRFMAAKATGLPIYYIQTDTYSLWANTIAAGVRKAWALDDYMASYAEQGVPAYVWLDKLRERYPGMTPALIIRIHPGGYNAWLQRFRLGAAKFQNGYIESFCHAWCGVESVRRWRKNLIIAAAQLCEYGEAMSRLPAIIGIINRYWDEYFNADMPLSYTSELLLDLYNRRERGVGSIQSRSLHPTIGLYKP